MNDFTSIDHTQAARAWTPPVERQPVPRPVARAEARPVARRDAGEVKPPLSESVQSFTDLMATNNPDELPASLRAAAGYVTRNLDSLNPEDARQIQVKLLTKFSGLQGEPEFGALINALEGKIAGSEVTPEASIETGLEGSARTPEAQPAVSPEVQQQLTDMDHLIDVIDELTDMVDAGDQGAMVDISKKFDRWQEKLTSLPQQARADRRARAVDIRLGNLLGKVELYRMKNNPRYRN